MATIVSFSLGVPTICSSKKATPYSLKKCWNHCFRIYHNHSDLITNLGVFVLNTTILASKIFKQIPHIIHRSCYTALNFTGVMWINMQCRDLRKNGDDLYHNIKAKDIEGVVFTAAKVTFKSLNILLTGVLLTASIFSLCAFPEIALGLYSIMRPFSLFSLIVGIGSEIYDHKKNGSLIRSFEVIDKQPEKVQKIIKHFSKRLYHKKESLTESPEKRLARHTFKQLDHYVIEALHKELQEKQAGLTAQALKKRIKHKREETKANLGLIILGYLSMGICKTWPDTLLQSSVTWAMSLLYTTKMLWNKNVHRKLNESLT